MVKRRTWSTISNLSTFKLYVAALSLVDLYRPLLSISSSSLYQATLGSGVMVTVRVKLLENQTNKLYFRVNLEQIICTVLVFELRSS